MHQADSPTPTFNQLFEHAPDALVQTDERGTIVLVNREAERLFGWQRDELIGQPVEILIPLADRTAHAPQRARYTDRPVTRTMGAGTTPLRAVRKDGAEFCADISLSPLETGRGRTVIAAVRDLTERQRIEETLRRSEERYRQLIEGASEIFYKVATPGDPLAGKLEYVSRSAQAVTGRAPEDFLRDQQLWVRSIHPEDLPALGASTFTALTERRPVTRSYRIRDAEGRYRSIEDRVTPVVDGNGAVTGYTGVARDVTERLELEAQLLQSQRMDSMGRLAGGVAHDFNNLLTVILGTVDVALGTRADAETLETELMEIRRAAGRAADLTRQLLAYSRRLLLQPTVLDLNLVVADMLNMLRRLLPENIAIEFMPGQRLGWIRADHGQLEQVIVNLAVNARDAMSGGGTLTIQTSTEEAATSDTASGTADRHVVLTVRDTGVGMSETTRLQAFEPFFTTKEPGKGTGLGLSTVYGIIRQSEGSIDIDSETGLGSTFRIRLPQVDGPATSTARPRALRAAMGSETVLVVEDDDAVRRLATRMLEDAGYQVLGAATGEHAVSLLAKFHDRVRVVLTDVVMPGMSGPQLARLVAAHHPSVKVVFTSGYTDDAIGHHGVLDAGVHFVHKPYSAANLTAKIRQALDT